MFRRVVLVRAAVMALSGTGLVATTGSVRAEFAAAFTLSQAGEPARGPRVAIDADGDALFTWYRFDGTKYRVQARARSASGVFGPIQTLSQADLSGYTPDVAMNASGNAVFTWFRSDGTNYWIQARARSATGAFSPVQTIFRATGANIAPQVAIDGDGEAIIAWQRSIGANWAIYARARSAAGVLGPVLTISSAGQPYVPPRLVSDAEGDTIFAWNRSDGSHNRVQSRARSAAGTLGPVQTLSAAGQNASAPEVAIDVDGDALFVWARFDGSHARIQARRRSAAGVFGPVNDVSLAGQNASGPDVASDADGDALIAWSQDDGADLRIQARPRAASGALGAIQTFSQAGQDAREVEVAIDGDGDAVLGWQRSDGTNVRIQSRTRSSTGVLGALQTLSPVGQAATDHRVATDTDGDAVITWQRFDGADDRVQGAATQ